VDNSHALTPYTHMMSYSTAIVQDTLTLEQCNPRFVVRIQAGTICEEWLALLLCNSPVQMQDVSRSAKIVA
jgi:hypothetical protein